MPINMKKLILSAILLGSVFCTTSAQDEEVKQKGFKKENLFTGGSITVSFYSGGTILGGTPMFGYLLAPWVDAGVVLNYTYQGSRDVYVLDDKVRQHVFGPGVFTRIYPVKFLFAQAQLEHNFTNIKYSDPYGTSLKENNDANSLLVGAGIAQGRQRGSNSFFYLTILFDVLKNRYSPYVNNIYNSNGELIRTDVIPIFRAGINIALFSNRSGGDEREGGDGRRQPRNYDRY
jgi:hypothetical protein